MEYLSSMMGYETMPEQPAPEWKCHCGDFVVQFSGVPKFCFDCHCQSCAACCAYAERQAGGGGTSALNSEGGVKKAMFYCADCTLPEDAESKLYFMKVGEDGSNIRSATRCCNTIVNTASLGIDLVPFNRSALYGFDGKEFEPMEQPLYKGMCMYAANPSAISEPKSDGFPPDLLSLVMSAAAFAPTVASYPHKTTDPATIAVVPRTWDDPQ